MSRMAAMKVRILQPVTIGGEPRRPGDEVFTDENTAANLVRKGRVEIVDEAIVTAPAVEEKPVRKAKGSKPTTS